MSLKEKLRKWREAHTAMRTFMPDDWRPESLALIEAIHKPVHELAMFIPPAYQPWPREPPQRVRD